MIRVDRQNIFLILTVHYFIHAFGQQTSLIFGEQVIPVASPDNFDDIPAGTTERSFQFLNDLTITTNRSVEALQVAVDYPNEVIQFLT